MTRTPAAYEFYIDWDGDGDYGDTGEDVTADVRSEQGITWQRGRDAIRALAPPMAGIGALELDNRSRDYSPDNASSPLAGNVDAGRLISYLATWDGDEYPLYGGITEDVRPDPARGRRVAAIPSIGTLSRLRGKEITTALYQNITTGAAIGHVLDAVGWPALARNLATGQTTLRYWWCERADPFGMIVRLLNTEGPGAAIFEDGEGKIVFQDRHHRVLTTRSNTSQGTFSDDGGDAGPWHRQPFGYNARLREVINRCEIEVNTRTLAALAVVWTYGATITLTPYETITITATAGDPFLNALAPMVGVDYTATAGGVLSSTISRTSGQSTEITLAASVNGATIDGLQLRAQSLTRQGSRVRNADTAAAAASVARRGLRGYTREIWPEISRNVAYDFCNAIVGLYATPRATVSITLDNSDDAMMTHILNREISDRITIIETETGINDEFFIEHMAHKVDKGGHRHEAIFSCEIADTPQYAVWGAGRWGYETWGY